MLRIPGRLSGSPSAVSISSLQATGGDVREVFAGDHVSYLLQRPHPKQLACPGSDEQKRAEHFPILPAQRRTQQRGRKMLDEC